MLGSMDMTGQVKPLMKSRKAMELSQDEKVMRKWLQIIHMMGHWLVYRAAIQMV